MVGIRLRVSLIRCTFLTHTAFRVVVARSVGILSSVTDASQSR